MDRLLTLARNLQLLVLAGTLAAAATATAAEAPAPRNMVQNGDFELGPSSIGGPAMWSAPRGSRLAEHVAFAWDDSVARGGGYSVSVEILDTHPDEKAFHNWNQYVLGYQVGASYRVSAWIRTQNVTEGAFLVVQCWDRGMTELLGLASTQDTTPVAGTSDWTEVAMSFEVPAETGKMVFLFGMTAPGDRGGKAWCDDISFLRLPDEGAAAEEPVGEG